MSECELVEDIGICIAEIRDDEVAMAKLPNHPPRDLTRLAGVNVNGPDDLTVACFLEYRSNDVPIISSARFRSASVLGRTVR